MDASDFLVVHYMFEEDLFVASKEEAEAKSDIRTSLYRNLYEREYQHKVNKTSSGDYKSSSMTYADGSLIGPPEDDLSDINQFDPDPIKKEKKPFIPATDFNPESVLPFGKDIDAPLG